MTIFVLALNDMRHAHFEDLSAVCWAETIDELRAFVERERVGEYVDVVSGGSPWGGGEKRWGKRFRRGGPLEWRNDLVDGYHHFVRVGAVDPNIIPHVSALAVETTGEVV